MNYNTLKTDIANVVKTNGNEEITGALLQQCLLAMISNLGQYYQYGGILLPSETVTVGDVRMAFLAGPGTYSNIGDFTIESGKIGVFTYDTEWHLRTIDLFSGDIKFCGIAHPEDSPAYDGNRRLSYFASEAGTYTEFDEIEVYVGEIAYLTYDNSLGWAKEILFDLQDYILQTPGTSQTKTMSQKAITDAISAIVQFMNAGWYFGGVVTPDSDEPAAPGTNEPKRVFYIAVGPGVFPLEEALELADGELGIVFYDWEQYAMVDYQRIELYATQGMLTSAVNQLTEKIAEESAKKVSLNSVEQSLVAGSAMSLSGKSAIVEFLNRIVAARNLVGRGAAAIKSIHGKTLAWNQLVQNGNFDDSTGWIFDGVGTIANNEAVVTSAGGVAGVYRYGLSIKSGNKYFISCYAKVSEIIAINLYLGMSIVDGVSITPSIANQYIKLSGIIQARSTTIDTIQCNASLAQGETISIKDVQVTDLTIMFGAGNEPSTVAEFESEFPGYHAYNPGVLISNDAESLETVGFNKLVEQPINIIANSWPAFSKDKYTRVIGGQRYYVYHPALSATNWRNAIKIYDLNGVEITSGLDIGGGMYYNPGALAWIDGIDNTYIEGEITFPVDCYIYWGFGYGAVTASTPIPNACLNFFDPARNGQYEPYKKSVCTLNLKTRRGKLNGQGASVVVFPDGMNGVGTSFDEANRTKGTKRRGRVNLGDLEWNKNQDNIFYSNDAIISQFKPTTSTEIVANIICSKFPTIAWRSVIEQSNGVGFYDAPNSLVVYDASMVSLTAAEFKAAMDGVYLDYELAEPQEYVWDEPMANAYAVEYLGTETVIPGNTTDPASAPFVADIAYPLDTEHGLVSIGTLDNLLSSLVSSGVIPGYSLQFNDNTGDYDVIIG